MLRVCVCVCVCACVDLHATKLVPKQTGLSIEPREGLFVCKPIRACCSTRREFSRAMLLDAAASKRALVCGGANDARLVGLASELRQGGDLVASLLGGSVTAGASSCCGGTGCSISGLQLLDASPAWCRSDVAHWRKLQHNFGRPGWFTFFLDRLRAQFNSSLGYVNVGSVANSMQFATSCPRALVPSHTNLVIVEYAINGGSGALLEALLAQIDTFPRRPAVVVLLMHWWVRRANGQPSHSSTLDADRRVMLNASHPYEARRRLRLSVGREDETAAGLLRVACQRKITVISARAALEPLLLHTRGREGSRGSLEGTHLRSLWPMGDWAEDGVHPETANADPEIHARQPQLYAHWIAAWLEHALLQAHSSTVTGFAARTPAAAGPTAPDAAVRCYRFDGNPRSALMPRRMVNITSSSEGAFRHVQHPLHGNALQQSRWKPGLVATVPGAMVEFELDSRGDAGAGVDGKSSPLMVIRVMHLTSYEHMGMARVLCVRGCSCTPQVLQAHSDQQRASLEQQGAALHASPHEACALRVQVLNQTKAPDAGHKLKLLGLVVEDPGRAWQHR